MSFRACIRGWSHWVVYSLCKSDYFFEVVYHMRLISYFNISLLLMLSLFLSTILRSSSKVIHLASEINIWSTQYGFKQWPHGVLCVFVKLSLADNFVLYSIQHSVWPQIVDIWSTLYGILKQPYGVLSMVKEADICGVIKQRNGVLHIVNRI